MLHFLRVRHFALIDDLTLEFGRGLNLLTGETGAGKSLIVDALGLVAGAKASSSVIRGREGRAVIEAVFEHPQDLDLETVGVDGAENELVVRREIASDNRNRVFINNQPCTVAALRTVASRLLDIHGQHEHQTLLEAAEQLALVDRGAGTEDLRLRLAEVHGKLRSSERELETLHQRDADILERTDFLEFVRGEIERVDPLPGEAERLRGEAGILENSGKLLEATAHGYESLYESDTSILSALARIESSIRDASAHDPRLESILESLTGARAALEDIAYALRDYQHGLDANPEALERIQARLAELERLHRKYGPDLVQHLKKVIDELDSLGLRDSRKSIILEELARLRTEYDRLAADLSRRRRRGSDRLSREVTHELRELAMPEAAFSVDWEPQEPRSSGIDRVRFLLAPNPGEPSGPLSDLASGGELSRAMLALRTVLTAEQGHRTLVFDEVDAGIGGKAALEVGGRLGKLSESYQVLCVTHLPQIARFADHHFRIDKVVRGDRTVTEIHSLDRAARVEELARMMSGSGATAAARRHVRELLEKR